MVFANGGVHDKRLRCRRPVEGDPLVTRHDHHAKHFARSGVCRINRKDVVHVLGVHWILLCVYFLQVKKKTCEAYAQECQKLLHAVAVIYRLRGKHAQIQRQT